MGNSKGDWGGHGGSLGSSTDFCRSENFCKNVFFCSSAQFNNYFERKKKKKQLSLNIRRELTNQHKCTDHKYTCRHTMQSSPGVTAFWAMSETELVYPNKKLEKQKGTVHAFPLGLRSIRRHGALRSPRTATSKGWSGERGHSPHLAGWGQWIPAPHTSHKAMSKLLCDKYTVASKTVSDG